MVKHVVLVIFFLCVAALPVKAAQEDKKTSHHGVELLTKERVPHLQEWVAICARQLGIEPPMLVVTRENDDNATAKEGFMGPSVVVIGKTLLQMPDQQITFVLAHELAHLAHGHQRKALMMMGLQYLMLGCLALASWKKQWDSQATAALLAGIFVTGQLTQAWYARRCEGEADVTAVRLVGDTAGFNAFMTRLAEDEDIFSSLLALVAEHSTAVERKRIVERSIKMA